MDLNSFIEKFAEAIELGDSSVLSRDTVFRTLPEWDSLSYLSVIAMMDEEYDIQIENADFKQLLTIEDLVNYISNR